LEEEFQTSKEMKLWRRFRLTMDKNFHAMFFNNFLLVTKEQYMQMMVAGILFYYIPIELDASLSELNPKQYIHNKALAILCFVMTLGVQPLLALVIYFTKKKTLMKISWRRRFGVMYEDYCINTKTHKFAVFLYF
jgi:hypothetical protein